MEWEECEERKSEERFLASVEMTGGEDGEKKERFFARQQRGRRGSGSSLRSVP